MQSLNRQNVKNNRNVAPVGNRAPVQNNNSPANMIGEAIPPEIRLGYWAIAVSIGAILIWASTLPLQTGAIAEASVIVEGKSRQVQHLDGGVIKDIFIKEGDLIKQGQPLLELDSGQSNRKLVALESKYIRLQARDARLQAEARSRKVIRYPEWLLEQRSKTEVEESINHQDRIFQSNIDLTREKEITFQHRISQTKNLIRSYQARLISAKSAMRTISTELNSYQRFLDQGLVTREQKFSLTSSRNQMLDQVQSIQGDLDSSQDRVAQYKAELSEYKMSQKNQAVKELDLLQDEMGVTKKDYFDAQKALGRTNVKAPINGYVVNLKTNTIGGVISAGEVLMEIVPSDENLIIEAKIDPKDRDSIAVGQKAEVRFTAFSRRTTVPVQGEVIVVSADRMTDPETGMPHYSTKIRMTEDPSTKLNGALIHPGMLAQVMIKTERKTAITFLLSPIMKSFDRSLRETN